MAWTQQDVDKLKAAIATGYKTVSYSDKTVTYQNASEMIQALALMEPAVVQEEGSSGGARSTRVAFSRE